MAKIKNMGHATVRFNEGTIISGSAGSDSYALVVTGSSILSEDLTVSGDVEVSQNIKHIDDADTFAQWMLEEFDLDRETVMLAPAAGFYSTPNTGRDQVRIAYVLNKSSLNLGSCPTP